MVNGLNIDDSPPGRERIFLLVDSVPIGKKKMAEIVVKINIRDEYFFK